MHMPDCGAWSRVALAPGLVLALSLSGSPAGAPLSPNPLAGQLPGAASAQTASDAAGSARGLNDRRAPAQGAWRGRDDSDLADATVSACGRECLERLRQRLLDHHREAAPVWVF